jgi:hypothetical protein
MVRKSEQCSESLLLTSNAEKHAKGCIGRALAGTALDVEPIHLVAESRPVAAHGVSTETSLQDTSMRVSRKRSGGSM